MPPAPWPSRPAFLAVLLLTALAPAPLAIAQGRVHLNLQDLAPDDGESGDHYGIDLAIDGDWAIVGADAHSAAGSRAGTAYLYWRVGDVWTFDTKLLPDPGADQRFGAAVDISGDRAVVGAPGADFFTGAAFVYRRSLQGGWSLEQELRYPNANVFDRVGSSVAIEVDQDDPEGSRIVVGARGDDEFARNGGSVAVFQLNLSVGAWIQEDFFAPDDVAEGDSFGHGLDLDLPWLLVGAPGSLEVGKAAYLFGLSPSLVWEQRRRFSASAPVLGDNFGGAVALAFPLVAIGADAAGIDPNPPAGAIHLFHRDVPVAGEWGGFLFEDPGAQPGDRVGSAVALEGSVGSDEFDLFHGANEADDSGIGSGAAAVTRIEVTTPSASPWSIGEPVRLVVRDLSGGGGGGLSPFRSAATLAGGDSFGDAIAVSGGTVLVGARFGDRDDGVQTGAAYVFEVPEPDPALLAGLLAAALGLCRWHRARS